MNSIEIMKKYPGHWQVVEVDTITLVGDPRAKEGVIKVVAGNGMDVPFLNTCATKDKYPEVLALFHYIVDSANELFVRMCALQHELKSLGSQY